MGKTERKEEIEEKNTMHLTKPRREDPWPTVKLNEDYHWATRPAKIEENAQNTEYNEDIWPSKELSNFLHEIA